MKIFGKDREVNAFEVPSDDPAFLRSEENTYLFFGANLLVVRMLSGKKENYTAGTIQFRELGLKPADLMGQKCSHCKRAVEEVHTACVGLHQNHVKTLFHESCFARWFSAQDKTKLQPYRFVRPRKRTLIVEGSSFQIQINQSDKVPEYTFEALHEVPYSSLGELAEGQTPPQAGSAAASMFQAGSMMGDPGASRAGSGVDPGGQGMSLVGGGASLAGLVAPSPGAGGGSQTQTMILCPHCSQPVMLSFEARKLGG